MKIKTFGSVPMNIEKKLEDWLNENEGIEVKHLAMTLNAASDWGLVLIIYEPKKETVPCEEKATSIEPLKNNT